MLKARINQFISKVTNRPPPPILHRQPQSTEAQRENNRKIVHGKSNICDLFTAEFEINDVQIVARNILTKGQTHDEISQYSGASISTRGRFISPEEKARGLNDSNSRSLYLFIQGNTKEALQLAIEKIKSIIFNTQALTSAKIDISRMSKYNFRPPFLMAPQQGNNQSTTFIEKLMIGLENAPPTFNVREQIIGVGGANLQYIRNETGAIATLRGRGSLFTDPVLGNESPEPLHLYIEHQRFDGLQAAKQLAKNLIETLQQEVVHLQQQSSQNSQNATLASNNAIIQQGQHVTHLNVPPPMLVPPPVIQQNPLDLQGNQATLVQQNFIQQNPPPNLSGPPPTAQPQQQTFIHQQIIPQQVPIQLQQSNVVIQQPVQQQSTAIGNVNMPPPGMPFPIKAGQILQFQTPPPTAAGTAHLTQPPPNIQLQQQPSTTTQIVLNPQQSYQYQYIQQPVQAADSAMQPNQVTIQHIYQPQHQIQGIVQQTQQQPQTQQIHAAPAQQYFTVQGNTAFMMPPPTIIQQQAALQHNPHTQMQAQLATSNQSLIFQPPPQLQQVQMEMTQGIPVQNIAPSLAANSVAAQQENQGQNANSDESTSKEDTKPEADQSESPQKSPKIKSETDLQSNDSDNEIGSQSATRTNVAESTPHSQDQAVTIKQQTPSVSTSITLPMTQIAPPIMAVPPPMSCVQHFVGNTLITTHPTAQTHPQQIYTQVPVSIQHLPHTGQQIHVSASTGQHFLVNATPHWQGAPSTATLTQQTPQQITQNGTVQNVQIAAAQSIVHNNTDFRAIPPPTLVSHTNQGQHAQQHPLAVTFNPQVQVQFQPQLIHQIPHQQTIESAQIMSGQISSHPQHQFNVVQQQQPQISYQQTVISQFPPPQQQVKHMMYQEQIIRSGQKRKHEGVESVIVNQQPRMGMGQRDPNQPMHTSHHQSPHQGPRISLAAHGNLPVIQTINGSSNNSNNAGQDENTEAKIQTEIHLLAQQAHPPIPSSSGVYPDNRSCFQRGVSEAFGESNPRQHYETSVGGGSPMLRGSRFHHNTSMIGIGGVHPMRPPLHMPPDGNFPMQRMNFGAPPPQYRGDGLSNVNGNYGPPPRFRGQW